MSVKIMGMVWDLDNEVIDREEKYVLLAYADHADHKGYNIFPAISTIMQKTGYKERAAQIITKSLVSKGFLIADGKGPKGTNKWRVPLDKDGVRIAPAENAPPQDETDWGADGTVQGVQQDAPEPSLTVTNPLINNTVKDKCLSILEHYGFTVFGNNNREWLSIRRRLLQDDVSITGDEKQITVSGLKEKPKGGQFTQAEIWQERIAPYFSNLGLVIRFET